MKTLSDFCFTRDDCLGDAVCDELVKIFKENSHLHERYDNNKIPNFTQLNLMSNNLISPQMKNHLVHKSFDVVREYKQKNPEETSFWPKRFGFEEFRIKHYEANGIDEFDIHVDAISNSTAKRFLVFFWYINDVEEGGHTDFPYLNISVKPKKGSVFVFPPMWLFPHKGCPVTKGEKYLLSSYLHYGE